MMLSPYLRYTAQSRVPALDRPPNWDPREPLLHTHGLGCMQVKVTWERTCGPQGLGMVMEAKAFGSQLCVSFHNCHHIHCTSQACGDAPGRARTGEPR